MQHRALIIGMFAALTATDIEAQQATDYPNRP